MIHEAVDTAITLGWALAVWIVFFAVAATAVVYALVVAAAFAWLAVTRDCTAGLAAVQRGGVPEVGPEPQETADARAVPTWARTDTEEAA